MRFGFVGCAGCGAKLPAWLMWLHRCGDAVGGAVARVKTENPRLTAFREYRALKDAAETRDQKMERRNLLAKELWVLDCELAGFSGELREAA